MARNESISGSGGDGTSGLACESARTGADPPFALTAATARTRAAARRPRSTTTAATAMIASTSSPSGTIPDDPPGPPGPAGWVTGTEGGVGTLKRLEMAAARRAPPWVSITEARGARRLTVSALAGAAVPGSMHSSEAVSPRTVLVRKAGLL